MLVTIKVLDTDLPLWSLATELQPGDLEIFAAGTWHARGPSCRRLARAQLIDSNPSCTRIAGWLQFYRTALGNKLGKVTRRGFLWSEQGRLVQCLVEMIGYARRNNVPIVAEPSGQILFDPKEQLHDITR